MATAPRLDTLPLELRERIVSFGSYKTLLDISLTSRALRQACTSVSVIKDILNNRNGCGGRVWQYPRLSLEAPASDWARYALADLKASEAGLDRPILTLCTKLMLWAPHLMALNHPFVSNTMMDDLTFNNNEKNISIGHYFCTVMKHMLREREVGDSALEFLENIPVARQRFQSCFLKSMMKTSAPLHGPARKRRAIQATRGAYTTFEPFILALRKKLAKEPPPQGLGTTFLDSSSLLHSLPAPDSYSIPFGDFMDLPLPFTDDAPEAFAICHLRQTTSPSFLEDGEWGGYYSLPASPFQHGGEVMFDPPMDKIQFAVESTDDSAVYIQGTGGSDRVGHFTLSGTVDTETGALSMVKQYVNDGPRWTWVGFLTPFGIIAAWGGGIWGGWVWLYKAAWCRKESS